MGKQWKQCQTLFSWAPKSLQMVTAAMKWKDTCSLEEKLWRTLTAYQKSETLLCWQSPSSQSYGFSSSHVRMWELDHNKPERHRIDAYEVWCWRRLFRVPWTARSSKQWILKEINPEYPLQGLMLTLKLQYLGPLMWRAKSLEKTLIRER